MERKQAVTKLKNIYELYGDETSHVFKNAIVKAMFILNNRTKDSCTKDNISEVSECLELLYGVFDFNPELVKSYNELIKKE